MTKPVVILYYSDEAMHGVTDCQIALEGRTQQAAFYPTGLPSFRVSLAALKMAIRMLEDQASGQNRTA